MLDVDGLSSIKYKKIYRKYISHISHIYYNMIDSRFSTSYIFISSLSISTHIYIYTKESRNPWSMDTGFLDPQPHSGC